MLITKRNGPGDAQFLAGAAADAAFRVHLAALAAQEALAHHPDGLLGTVEQTSLAGGANLALDFGLDRAFFAALGRSPSVRIKDRPSGTGVEAGSASDAKQRIDVVLGLGLPGNGLLRAFLGAGPAADAVFGNLI